MELSTPDASAAKQFYGELYGWEALDVPAGPDMTYSMLKLRGLDVGALCQDNRPGSPVCWNCYVAVSDVDKTIAEADTLGGSTLMGPIDVMEHGRMAVLKDPSGAAFCVWQARGHQGAGLIDEPGAHCWTELMTTDTEACERFYSALGWGVNRSMPNYTMFTVADKSVAGMMPIKQGMGGVPPHWLPYFQVADCDASAAKVAELGGQVVVPPTDVPGVGRFAIYQDPQGAVSAMMAMSN
jgi:predicted enzyme related to lactoylglutathione lyase